MATIEVRCVASGLIVLIAAARAQTKPTNDIPKLHLTGGSFMTNDCAALGAMRKGTWPAPFFGCSDLPHAEIVTHDQPVNLRFARPIDLVAPKWTWTPFGPDFTSAGVDRPCVARSSVLTNVGPAKTERTRDTDIRWGPARDPAKMARAEDRRHCGRKPAS
jgi:hypothetical protein